MKYEKELDAIRLEIQNVTVLTPDMMKNPYVEKTAADVRLGLPMSIATQRLLKYYGVKK